MTELGKIQNIKDPKKLLEVFLSSDNLSIRVAIAKNQNIDNKLMYRLAHDKSAVVKKELLRCQHVSKECLEVLVRDQNTFVRDTARLALRNMEASSAE